MHLRHRFHAWLTLLRSYVATFRRCWPHRDRRPPGYFRRDEAAFLPAALAVQESPPSPTARLTARLIIVLIAAALLWSVFGKVEIIVNAEGKLIPSAYTKTLAAVETGSVVALPVKEGQHVKAGQIVLQLDTSALDADHAKAHTGISEAALTIGRNQALITAITTEHAPVLASLARLNAQFQSQIDSAHWVEAASQLQAHYRNYRAKMSALNDAIRHYRQLLPLVSEQANQYRQLRQTQDVSHDAWLEKEQARLQVAAQLLDARHQQRSLTEETIKNALDQIADARRVADASLQDARRAAGLRKLLTLRAPVDGTVHQLMIHTLGGVVAAAQPILQIVPTHSPVEVEAYIANKDKGFVLPGQLCQVKIQTFDYTKYGTLAGNVRDVSSDAVVDSSHNSLNFIVHVVLTKQAILVNRNAKPVVPGMAVSVAIKTGERRIIEYLLSPVFRTVHEAGHER